MAWRTVSACAMLRSPGWATGSAWLELGGDTHRRSQREQHRAELSDGRIKGVDTGFFFCCFQPLTPPRPSDLLRGIIVLINRTCGTHKYLYVEVFLPTIFDPIYLLWSPVIAYQGIYLHTNTYMLKFFLLTIFDPIY